MNFIKKYKYTFLMLVILSMMYFINKDIGSHAFRITLDNIVEMLSFLPAIFILVGLLDVWVEKDTIIKWMGKNSGLEGLLIAFILATLAAGPLYAAFPIAALLLKKGARLSHVLFFLGVWSSTKLPIFLYETASLGLKFTLIHVSISLPAYWLMGVFIEKTTSMDAINILYKKAQSL